MHSNNQLRAAHYAARTHAEQTLPHDQHTIFGIDQDLKVRHDITSVTTSEFYVFFACYESICIEGVNQDLLILRQLNEHSF